MVDLIKLNDIIAESGMTLVAISSKTGIIRATLYNRLTGKSEFKASEIENLSNVLNLDSDERDEIFFAPKVELKETFARAV